MFSAICSPRFDLPIEAQNSQSKKSSFICHFCNEIGHKAVACPQLMPSLKREQTNSHDTIPYRPPNSNIKHDLRPLEQVTCFKVSSLDLKSNISVFLSFPSLKLLIICLIFLFNIHLLLFFGITLLSYSNGLQSSFLTSCNETSVANDVEHPKYYLVLEFL